MSAAGLALIPNPTENTLRAYHTLPFQRETRAFFGKPLRLAADEASSSVALITLAGGAFGSLYLFVLPPRAEFEAATYHIQMIRVRSALSPGDDRN